MNDWLVLLIGLITLGWMMFAVLFDDRIKRRI